MSHSENTALSGEELGHTETKIYLLQVTDQTKYNENATVLVTPFNNNFITHILYIWCKIWYKEKKYAFKFSEPSLEMF